MHSLHQFIRNSLSLEDQLSEIIFGLIMVLGFTSTISIATTNDTASEAFNANLLLSSAIGCNLAWGLVDGIMYILGSMAERSQNANMLHVIRQSGSKEEAIQAIATKLDPALHDLTTSAERQALYQNILTVAERVTLPKTVLKREDVYGAIATCLLVVGSTFPPVLPFLVIQSPRLALRVSNGIAIAMLFFLGYYWAAANNSHRITTGLLLAIVGMSLVGITVALGG
jgi:VIT1/CCC1 family predicted Fe2+/Mn2+ transporter